MSEFSRLELSSMNNPDSKYYNMKQFISAVQEYMSTRTEDTASIINRHLQLLSVTIDMSVFDPHTSIASEFFVCLHELLSALEPHSHLAWCCVNVLSISCRNSAARNALIHTYQFVPPLSRLLGDQITNEKKMRLLNVMQELTCGIKISWQIPHLPHLISTLTKWIVNVEQEEIVTLSLGVLVNLCYKNLPAIYTLSRCVDVKNFLKKTSTLQGAKIEVHVCKLFIILENMCGKVPEESLKKLVEVTFKSINEAFRTKDSILLRHTIEFFMDIKLSNEQENIILYFDCYDVEVDRLLTVIENTMSSGDTNDEDAECMCLVLEFLNLLVELQLPKLLQFYSRLITISLRWIQNDAACSQALAILRTISVCTTPNNGSLVQPLVNGLPIFLIALEHNDEEIPTHAEYSKRMSALMELLRALVRADGLRDKVLSVLKEQHLYKIFAPLIGSVSPRMRANNADTYSDEAVNLYINAFALTDELAKHKDVWRNMHTSLLQQKRMHMILAKGIFNGPKHIKQLILDMAPRFPKDDITAAMVEIQPLFQIESKSDNSSQHMADNLCFPSLSITQSEKLDEIINKIKIAVSQSNVFNIATSDVMELYEYKLASMGHSERAATASVEAASQRCTHLQHRTAQLTAELSRLHQLLLHTQQCSEDTIKNRDSLGTQCKELTNRLDAEKGRCKVMANQLESKEKVMQETEFVLDDCRRKLRESESAKMRVEDLYTNLKVIVTKLEETSKKKEKAYEKKEELLTRANNSIEVQKGQIMQLENQLAEVMKDLATKKQIIDTITKLTHSESHQPFK